MSSVACPRCEESFRVPDAPLPPNVRMRCPWCSETFKLQEVFQNLLPMVQLIDDDDQPIELASALASMMPASVAYASSSALPRSKFDHAGVSRETLPLREPTSRLEPVATDDFDPNETMLTDQTTLADDAQSEFTINETDEELDLDQLENLDEPGAEALVSDSDDFSSESASEEASDDDEDYDYSDPYQTTVEHPEGTPVTGPVAPRPLSSVTRSDFGDANLAAKPRARKKSSPIKSLIGVVLGGAMAVPLAGLALKGLAAAGLTQEPNFGFWPFDGGPAAAPLAGAPMQLSGEPKDRSFKPREGKGLPAGAFSGMSSTGSDDVATSSNDPGENDTGENDPGGNNPGANDPGDGDRQSPDNTNVESSDADDTAPVKPVLTADPVEKNGTKKPPSTSGNDANASPSVVRESSKPAPAEVAIAPIEKATKREPAVIEPAVIEPAVTEPAVIEPAVTKPAEMAVVDNPEKSEVEMPSDSGSAPAVAPSNTESATSIAGSADAPKEPTDSPPIPSPSKASAELADAIQAVSEALDAVNDKANLKDAAALKRSKATLYAAMSTLGLIPQGVNQTETLDILSKVKGAGLMTEMKVAGPNWLKYVNRPHAGLLAFGKMVRENEDWTLVWNGPSKLVLKLPSGYEPSEGESVVILGKIIDQNAPATVQLVVVDNQSLE